MSGYGDPEGTDVEARKRPVPAVSVPVFAREPGYALASRFWCWVFNRKGRPRVSPGNAPC